MSESEKLIFVYGIYNIGKIAMFQIIFDWMEN